MTEKKVLEATIDPRIKNLVGDEPIKTKKTEEEAQDTMFSKMSNRQLKRQSILLLEKIDLTKSGGEKPKKQSITNAGDSTMAKVSDSKEREQVIKKREEFAASTSKANHKI